MRNQLPAKVSSSSTVSGGDKAVEDGDATDFLTVQDVAVRLKCSRALVYLLCEKGRLCHHRLGVGRGTIRVSERDLQIFLEAAHVEPQRLTTAVGLRHIRLNGTGS